MLVWDGEASGIEDYQHRTGIDWQQSFHNAKLPYTTARQVHPSAR